MNPDEEQQPVSAQYLDQISPQAVQKPKTPAGSPIFIGGLIIAFLVAVVLLTISSTPKSSGLTEQFAVSLVGTKIVTDKADSTIKSTKLRAINVNLGLFLSGTISDFGDGKYLANEKATMEGLKASAEVTQFNKKILANLEDARLNAIYDRTYGREMAYRLETMVNIMERISKNISNKKLKSLMEEKYNDLEPILDDLAKYNAASD